MNKELGRRVKQELQGYEPDVRHAIYQDKRISRKTKMSVYFEVREAVASPVQDGVYWPLDDAVWGEDEDGS